MKEFTKEESNRIQAMVTGIYDDILNRYDATKYPEDVYQKMISVFSEKSPINGEIENAMKWK